MRRDRRIGSIREFSQQFEDFIGTRHATIDASWMAQQHVKVFVTVHSDDTEPFETSVPGVSIVPTVRSPCR